MENRKSETLRNKLLYILDILDFKISITRLTFILVSTAILFNIIGCATIKPYPVCFDDCEHIKKEEREKIITDLAEYLKKESKSVIIHPSSKWILAKTNYWQHKRLIKIWPRMACIGDVTAGTQVTKNSQCVEYIYNFMVKKNYLQFDINSNPVHSDEAPGKPHVICCCQF